MKSLYVIPVTLILLAILPSQVLAQEYKREKEERIKREDMPGQSLEALLPFISNAKRIRFYRETDGRHLSYEGKFRIEGRRYSVEFNEYGVLEDIEVLIKFDEIPPETRTTIETYLDAQYDRYRIRRLQKQCRHSEDDADPEMVLSKVFEGDTGGLVIRYEIEVDGSRSDELVSHELLFDHAGNFLQKRTIIRRQIDNILY